MTALAASAAEPARRAPAGEFRAPTPPAAGMQDPDRNNLVAPPGSVAGPVGRFPSVAVHGEDGSPLVLLPGLGLTPLAMPGLVDRLAESHRVYAVTLPGYGGSAPPPAGEPLYAEGPWVENGVVALDRLVAQRKLGEVTLVAFYSEAAHIALRYAIASPDQVREVIVISAAISPPEPPVPGETRADKVDRYAQQWFRTVTPIMWASGMFSPESYDSDPVKSEALWWSVLDTPLYVAVRYTLEVNAADLASELSAVDVPIRVINPTFAFMEDPARRQWTDRWFNEGWRAAASANESIELRLDPALRLGTLLSAPGSLYSEDALDPPAADDDAGDAPGR